MARKNTLFLSASLALLTAVVVCGGLCLFAPGTESPAEPGTRQEEPATTPEDAALAKEGEEPAPERAEGTPEGWDILAEAGAEAEKPEAAMQEEAVIIPENTMKAVIDYYGNGRKQTLTAEGDRVILTDRKGKRHDDLCRIRTGQPILLGPAAYDFAGHHKYNVLLLLQDGSVQMYNLEGRQPAKWKGIRVDETITALPEYLDKGAKSYWILRCQKHSYIFGFYGGEPLQTLDGPVDAKTFNMGG